MRLRLAIVLLATTACGSGGPVAEFAVDGDYLAVSGPDGLEPIFIKGVNLGVGVPGTYPGQLALDRETYLRWFARMKEVGFNTVRIYTLHHPVFYEAVFEYNNFRPDDPIYIMHGTWLDEENPTGGLDIYDLTDSFDVAIEEVIDAVHGNAEITHRLGRGFGTYEIDISRWVIGYIIGREIYGAEALTGNLLHPEQTSFEGKYLRIEGTPTEVWATARLDHALSYEGGKYGEQRPVAFSSWPTLDPLYHVSERHGADLSMGLETGAGEDDVQIDVTKIETVREHPGLFASYHAYPYYPDFIYRDPDYVAATDELGPNNYVGYLNALKEHYRGMPLMISEYGVPSSWGNAHVSDVAGMDHGGHDEVAQGQILARLTRNIADTDCAGGIAFAWMDEWWKRTWIVAHRTYPVENYPLWFDVTSPEQNYGLIAYDLPEPRFETWPEIAGSGRILSARVDADAAFLHLDIDLAAGLADGETLTIGVDTYRDDLGESILPGGIATPLRSEIAVVIEPNASQVYVTEAYDRFGFFHGLMEPGQVGTSTATDGGEWRPWTWITSGEASSDDGQMVFPQVNVNQGALRTRRATEPSTTLDAVVIDDNRVSLRVPWTLLNIADPSQLTVVHDDLRTEFRHEAQASDGIRLAISIGADLVTTGRILPIAWDQAPETVEREKPAMAAIEQALAEIPDRP